MRIQAIPASQQLRRYHLGCGDDRLDGFVNVDIRRTAATDLTLDLNQLDLPPRSAELLFSNAMFEHLRRPQRVVHLRAAQRALDPERGAACYIGVPYFREVARAYLAGEAGTAGPLFDLYNVYRYTHGDPDGVDWYLEQLHKSLFDEDELDGLLSEAGFGAHSIFCYAYPGDYAPVRVTMGFYATVAPLDEAELHRRLDGLLARFDGRRIDLATLHHLLVRTGSAVSRRPLSAGAPAPAGELRQAGLAAWSDGRPADAAELLRDAVARELDLETVNDLAVALNALGRDAEARTLLEACLVICPDRADAAENLRALSARPLAS